MQISPGEVVQLKSGGPDMTVEFIDDEWGRGVCCSWFEGKKRQRGFFEAHALKQVNAQSDLPNLVNPSC